METNDSPPLLFIPICTFVFKRFMVMLSFVHLAQQSGEASESATSTEGLPSTVAPQSRAITTVTQATPLPGPAVPVSGDTNSVLMFDAKLLIQCNRHTLSQNGKKKVLNGHIKVILRVLKLKKTGIMIWLQKMILHVQSQNVALLHVLQTRGFLSSLQSVNTAYLCQAII